MSYKLIFLLCTQLLIQSISSQCMGAIGAPFMGPMTAPCAGAWGAPYAEWAFSPVATLAASNGPGLAITTSSPLIPAGVSVLSENVYEGALAVGGALPFLGTVAIEGALPTAGAGAVAYGCGNGAVAITAEDMDGVGFGAMGSLAAGPLAMGPVGAGPSAMGPFGAGPLAMGPLAAGPLAAAPLAMGPMAGAPFVEPWDAADVAFLAASNGPGVAVSTVSPLIPAGVSVLSDNAYEGILAAGGAVPFLGTVAIEGSLPTAGAGAVAYGCGNGAVGITAEDMGAIGFTGTLGIGPGLAGPFGMGRPGCGFGWY